MGKLKNGDAVHLVSLSGPQEGNALHSNMPEGAGLSWGGLGHESLGWVIELERTHRRKAIRAGDVVHLRPCGWGDGCSSDFYFHSNAPEGAMFSGGGRSHLFAWTIESDCKHIRDGDNVMLKAIAGPHDDSERGEYMHSNGDEGGGFSWGGGSPEHGWQLAKIDGWDTSKDDCKKVKNGAYIQLQCLSGSCEGSVLHSNMEEGAAWSCGGTGHPDLGWRVIAGDEDAGSIRYGMPVMLQGMGTGTFMHSNSPEGGMYSGGGPSIENGWIIEGGCEGDKVRYGAEVTLRCIAGPHDDSDRGPVMHSNAEEGGGFSFGGPSPEHGFRIIAIESPWSSDSSD